MAAMTVEANEATDERHMGRALELARRGVGAVEPNPPVGAVIVRDGRVIAEAYHQRFGGPHAEAAAIAAARQGGADLRGAVLYVTLEPCCAFAGKKTPPCADAIAAAGIARVVVAMADPDANVSQRGFKQLRAAGVRVDVGVGERKTRELLQPYIKLRTTGRPWVICKWAQSRDGYLKLPAESGRWVSNESSRAAVHALRAICDGVCVGVGTVLADDPLLTNRSGQGRRPVRLILDRPLRTPPSSALLRSVSDAPVLIATTQAVMAAAADRATALRQGGAEVLGLPGAEDGVDIAALLEELGRRQWTRLLVEGGANVLQQFVYGRLADELWVFVGPQQVGSGRGLPRFDIADVQKNLPLGQAERRSFGEDERLRFVLGQ